MSEDKGIRRKSVLSWAFYDWANSAFSTTVVAGFFPVFFREYWSAGGDIGETTLKLGYANSLASIIVAAIAPLLGAIADRGGTKKKFLFFFATMGIVMTGSLYLVTMGDWMMAVLLYVAALIGFSGGNIFYDSLIIGVAEPRKMDFISALGFSMGYLGGGLLFTFNVVMLLWPQTFGLADQSVAIRLSFLSVAVWWALFSIPLFLFVEEPHGNGTASGWSALSAGCRQLAATFREIRQLRMVFLFLVGYWFYIDGVDTVIRMAVDYGMALGFPTKSLLIALAITQAVGFPAAILFGKIGEKLGTKNGIFIGIGVYVGATVWGSFMDQTWEFYGLAVTIGLVQGGIQSLSRSFYTQLIPQNKAAEFFGFYNMLGKFATVIGPVMMGWVSVLTGNPRFSLLSLVTLFAIGGYMLYKVDAEEGRKMARSLEKF
jgi:MFS transporter, UMF1 family